MNNTDSFEDRGVVDYSQQRPSVEQMTSWQKQHLDTGFKPPLVEKIDVANAAVIPQGKIRWHAYAFLEHAVKEMKDRAVQRDKPVCQPGNPPGERSMAATVRAFNALTGHTLTEAEGWEFMVLLKLVRGRQGEFRADDYVDAAAYCGLLGECESVSR